MHTINKSLKAGRSLPTVMPIADHNMNNEEEKRAGGCMTLKTKDKTKCPSGIAPLLFVSLNSPTLDAKSPRPDTRGWLP